MKLFIINAVFICTILSISEAASVRSLGCNPDYETEYLDELPVKYVPAKEYSRHEPQGTKGVSHHELQGIKAHPVKYVSGIKLRKRRHEEDGLKHSARYNSEINLRKGIHEEAAEKRKKRFGGSWSIGRSGRRY
ncbi:uncharacterized protein LOC126884969 isoform X3 [Diabrotica virgifera virgifera]|uniref:Uncharacterized protein n=1 Tax=Diabrotica virgifera virgifera TaxID=50390 RepID=A0ABM5KAT7_DIAVI|nr:uncharacterized protein LOC126884969 isoform X3 [Diabrotica virgifera virgifera]